MSSPKLASPISPAQQDYLKALFHLGIDHLSVSTSEIADHLGVTPASATGMLAKLASLGLVTHDRYRGAQLTARGRAAALEMIRHHRLIEMFLAETLGYRWDEVHDEAERLEHVISERMEQRIFEALGRPAIDPHGDPIPSSSGQMAATTDRPLDHCRAGERLVVRRVSDRDPEKLRALKELGIGLGSRVELLGESRFEGPIEIRVSGRLLQVPLGLARGVFLEVAR